MVLYIHGYIHTYIHTYVRTYVRTYIFGADVYLQVHVDSFFRCVQLRVQGLIAGFGLAPAFSGPR